MTRNKEKQIADEWSIYGKNTNSILPLYWRKRNSPSSCLQEMTQWTVNTPSAVRKNKQNKFKSNVANDK